MGIQLHADRSDLINAGIETRIVEETGYRYNHHTEDEDAFVTEFHEWNIPTVGWVRSYSPHDLVIDNKNVNHHIREALDVAGVNYVRS